MASQNRSTPGISSGFPAFGPVKIPKISYQGWLTIVVDRIYKLCQHTFQSKSIIRPFVQFHNKSISQGNKSPNKSPNPPNLPEPTRLTANISLSYLLLSSLILSYSLLFPLHNLRHEYLKLYLQLFASFVSYKLHPNSI